MNPTRRIVNKAAASAILYRFVQSPPVLKAAEKNDSLGFGFIGVGIRGMILLEAFQKIRGVKPVIAADVYDGHLTRAKEVTQGAIATTRDYRKVLDNKDVDVVVIATPDHWHRQMALDALSAGKHIYLEKPMTWSIEQNLEVIAAVERSKKIMQIGSGEGSNQRVAKAREIVKSGVLGKINHIKMENNRNSPEGAWVYAIPPDASAATIDWDRFVGPSPKRAFDPAVFFRWRCWWEYSGGVATDLFVHMLTQLHETMDVPAPKSVVSQGGIFRWNDGRTVPDLLSSVFEYPEFLANLSVNLGNASGPRGMAILGSEGTLVSNGKGLTHYLEPKSADIQRYGTGAWPDAMRKQYFQSKGTPARTPLAKPKEILIEEGPSHQELFVTALRENKKSAETEWQGHAASGAAHLANIAFRKGRRMSWNWRTGQITEA